MTVSTTSRLGVTTWDAGSDPFTRAQMNDSHINLEARAAGFNQDATRPSAGAGFTGFFHFNNGILTYCDGVNWYDLVAVGSTVVDLTASAGTVGVSSDFARSDHRHGIATDAIAENMIQNNAVTRDKISNNSVDLTKLVDSASGYAVLGKTGSGSGDFAEITAGANSVLRRSGSGDLSFGTLSTAHIGNGQITTDKIGSQQVTIDKMAANSVGTDQYVDASIKAEHFAPGAVSGASVGEDSIDSINIQTGAIDTRHIADNQVTVGKIQQVAAHSILARVGTSTGNLSALVAGTDSVLRRDGSGNLAFGTIDGGHIGIDSIDSQHYAAGSIDREHLAPDIIDGTKIANDVINSEHYVAGSIDAEHLSNALYSSGTWQGALSGNAATASRWSNYRTITLGGDLTGSVQIRGDANVTLTATVAANSVALGTDTTGNYMAGVSAGTGVSVSHTPGEGSTATISIGQSVATTSNVTFNQVQSNRYDIGSQATSETWITRTVGNDLSFRFESTNLAQWHKTVATNNNSVLSSTAHAFQFHNHLIPFVTSTSGTTGRLLGDNNRAWNRLVSKNGSYLSSDATLKDIEGTAPGMDFVRMLTGYEWSWKLDDGVSFWGPTAQDIQAAVDASGSDAEIVTGEEGNLTVRMESLWGPVINALKELEERIVALGG